MTRVMDPPYVTAMFLSTLRWHLGRGDVVEVERVSGWDKVTSVTPSGGWEEDATITTERHPDAPIVVPEPWSDERARTYRVTEPDVSASRAYWERIMDRLADHDSE